MAISKYEEIKAAVTVPCGLFVCKTHNYIASSPDRVLDNDTVIEVKCPYTSRAKEISEVTVQYLRVVDDKLTLDTKHDYYYQVQGQLLCSGRQKCHFVVYTFVDMKIFEISRQ